MNFLHHIQIFPVSDCFAPYILLSHHVISSSHFSVELISSI